MKKFFVSVAAFVVFALIALLPYVASLELKALDVFRAPHAPHPDIVILAIDNKSLQAIGRWPWDRNVHAQLLEKMSASHPRALAFDVDFVEQQDVENDDAFAAALQNVSFPLILSASAVYTRGSTQPTRFLYPLPQFTQGTHVSTGGTNVTIAPDGLARTIPGQETAENTVMQPFAVAIAHAIGATVASSDGGIINFAGPAGSFPTYSISDVLAGKVSASAFDDKILLIGATASDLHDVVQVPPQGTALAGIEWHANVLDNLLLGRSVTPVPRVSIFFGSIILGVLLLVLFQFVSQRMMLLASGISIIALPVASFFSWRSGIGWSYVVPEIFVAGIFFFESLSRWLYAEAERRKLRRTIQNYFSPQVVQTILNDPVSLKLGGQRREVTIFFSDIRSFTTITESADPAVLSRLLHEYFTEMTEEIFATDGVVDKFIGDSIMAFWGAPLAQQDHADRAVETAVAMMKRLKTLQEKWKHEGLPVMDIGIGINTGMATVGNMGSEKRFDYTVIGDSVNAAARLEGLNKEYKTHIIISETTKNALTRNFAVEELGDVLVKGKTQSIKIFEVEIS
ncbi:MAG: adenylate/guanylate cyclase domain-containing protein [Candidatus Komeilibacteria bacterium]|nr:adenylate/guanylate cyclase domain-containing protein [Candidatus Komeilibacteria bacterium]